MTSSVPFVRFSHPIGGSGTWPDHEETDCEGIRVIDLPFFSIYAMMTEPPGLRVCLPGRMAIGKQGRSFYEGEYQEMKNRNKKMILVVFLTGILIMSGCAAMKENVSKGYSDHPENDASHLEKEVREKYDQLVQHLIKNNISVTAMESCTAGQIASLLTDTSGSSAIMKGAFVTYSNEAKIRAGVSEKTINEYGVYSKETAAEMARVCREYYDADIGIGVTGSFGNVDPKNEDSVPGEVYFAISTREGTESFYCEVPEQPSRLYYKLYMANVIADEIIKTVR